MNFTSKEKHFLDRVAQLEHIQAMELWVVAQRKAVLWGGTGPALLDTGNRGHLLGLCLFHVPLDLINGAVHLLQGRSVSGETADAPQIGFPPPVR
jgi:hypothetical protein